MGESVTEGKDPARRDAYAAAGVDINAANRALALIKEHIRSTFRPEVLRDIGLFGGLFQLGAYRRPVLVSSVDGVGTKLKIATLSGRLDTIGIDLVNHCINDIFTCGADPLFFLDYFAASKLVPEQLEMVVSGLALACRQGNCALIGGETAEMPGIYLAGEIDLVGCIVGIVERDSLIDGSQIAVGDAALGLPSSGLHTNGYSLVRQVFAVAADEPPEEGRARLAAFYPELGRTLAEELLEPHLSYHPLLKDHCSQIKGLAHITGGGLLENVPRILPQGLAVRFRRSSWPILPIFHLIQERGSIADEEMYRVFNMGLGMVVFCAPDAATDLLSALPQAMVVGEVVLQRGDQRIILE